VHYGALFANNHYLNYKFNVIKLTKFLLLYNYNFLPNIKPKYIVKIKISLDLLNVKKFMKIINIA